MITGKSSTTISKESTLDKTKDQGEKVATFFFYVLKCPDSGDIKYIGRTVDLTNRYRNHIYEAKKNNRNKRERWIVSLLRKNKKPVMKKIYEKECSLEEAIDIERTLVESFGKRYDLKNSPDNYLGAVLTGKKVYQYNLDGIFMEMFHNSNQAYIKTGVKDSNILRCCKNENGYGTKTAGGYFWSFIKYDQYPHQFVENWRNLKGKAVVQLSKEGEVLGEFETARLAEKSTGVSYKKISAVCNKRQKTAGGFIWRFKC